VRALFPFSRGAAAAAEMKSGLFALWLTASRFFLRASHEFHSNRATAAYQKAHDFII